MDPFVRLLEVHKLLHYMQEAGQPLRLQYKSALWPICRKPAACPAHDRGAILLQGMPMVATTRASRLNCCPAQSRLPDHSFKSDVAAWARFGSRSLRLSKGLRTPFGLELLATVHWVALNEDASTTADVIAQTHAWNERKRRFTAEQITLAQQVLASKGWLDQARGQSRRHATSRAAMLSANYLRRRDQLAAARRPAAARHGLAVPHARRGAGPARRQSLERGADRGAGALAARQQRHHI